MVSDSSINTLIIDITEQTSRTLRFDAELFGGVDLGLHLLARLRDDDPAAMVLATGRFSGTVTPSGSMVGAFSAPDGTVIEDYFPGSFGAQMLRAGWDAMALVGSSERALYVVVDDGAVTFHRAELLVNQPLPDARKRLLELVGDPAAATLITGPAADRGLAGAQVDGGVMGRSNMGELWAGKRLKAVVVRGSGDVRVPDALKLLDAVRGLKVEQSKLPGKFKKESNGMRACLQCRNPCRASFELDGSVHSFTFRELDAYSSEPAEVLKTLKLCYEQGVNPLACARLLGGEKSPSKKLAKLLEGDGIKETVPRPKDGTRLFDALLTCRLLPVSEEQLLKIYPLVTGHKVVKTDVQSFGKRIEKAAGELAKNTPAAPGPGVKA